MVSREMVRRFEVKRQWLSPGYSPQSSRELLDWVLERLIIPQKDSDELLPAMRRDHGIEPKGLADELKDKVVRVYPPQAGGPLITAREIFRRMIGPFYGGEKDIPIESIGGIPVVREEEELPPFERGGEALPLLLGQWLQFFGPTTPRANCNRSDGSLLKPLTEKSPRRVLTYPPYAPALK